MFKHWKTSKAIQVLFFKKIIQLLLLHNPLKIIFENYLHMCIYREKKKKKPKQGKIPQLKVKAVG